MNRACSTSTHGHWVGFYRDGQRYLATARGALKRPAVFTPEIVFNLVGMGIEKVAMAIEMEAGRMPENHTILDLVRSLSQVMDLDLDLAQDLIDLGGYEDLCAFGPRQHEPPTREELPAIVAIGERLLAAAEERLPQI